MAQFKKSTEKKPKTLPCDTCGVMVPVGDDAVGVICTDCTQKSLNKYQNALDNGEESGDEGGDNLTVEEADDRQKNPVQDKPRRTSLPKGRGKVRQAKHTSKPANARAKKLSD